MRDEIKRAFGAVQADAALREGTKEFLAQRLYRRPARRLRPAPLLACLALLAVALAGGRFYYTPRLTVSIDVNPSLELGINGLNRVISVEGFNSDGEAWAETLDLKYKDSIAALEEILASDELAEYLSADELVSIAVVSGGEEAGEKLLAFLEEETAGQENIYCCSASYQEVAPAHELGLSYGKYRACLALQSLDPELDLNEICHMTMRQIQDMTEACQEENGSQGSDSSSGWGSGEGCETEGQGHSGGQGGRHHGWE